MHNLLEYPITRIPIYQNYNLQDVRKDNFSDSLRKNDLFLRLGFSIKTSQNSRIFYQHGFDMGLNLVNIYHRYFYQVNEVGFRYIF